MHRFCSATKLGAILLNVVLANAAVATTYFVNPTTGNDSNDGLSTSFPVKTIVKAGTLAGPGDTVKLMQGHYQINDGGSPAKVTTNILFDSTWSGTSGNVITVEPNGTDIAIFDCGYVEFKTGSAGSPNSAWVSAKLGGLGIAADPTAPADEYVSVSTFARTTRGGHFLTGTALVAGDKLLTYPSLDELRGGYYDDGAGGQPDQLFVNESEILLDAADARRYGGPLWADDIETPELELGKIIPWTYRGPGLYYDSRQFKADGVTPNPHYQRIHIRLGATHFNQPGITDYTGETDPRKMPLGIYSEKNSTGSEDQWSARIMAAEVCCAAHERHKLEHLCRYITRPAIANERLTLNRAGDVVLQLKSPYHDGTTHVVMSPLELLQRLAALVPRPTLNCGPRSFHPRGANPGFHGEAISLCLAFPARRSTHPALQRFTLTRPIPRHQPAWAGPGCSQNRWERVLNGRRRPEGRKPGRAFVGGCSISTSSSVCSAVAP